ncbi:MAG TPA: hypothetical protein ENG33_05445 [Chloroflexi bacterium]|nr:hypothetical protein [Chloroflexota bacterium]
MSWLVANVDVVKVTLIALSVVFLLLDILVKSAFRMAPESAGADLCLAAVSFDASILVDNFNRVVTSPAPSLEEVRLNLYASFLLFLITLIFWVISLKLVAPPQRPRYSLPGEKMIGFSHVLANFLGFFSFALVIWLFVEV